MRLTRRESLVGAGAAVVGMAVGRQARAVEAESKSRIPRVGMCDWSMKKMDPSAFDFAKQVGLDGVQVSVGYPDNGLWLRRAEVQKRYLDAASKVGLAIPSVAMGVLNEVPLMSEPRAALWLADTIEVTRQVGAKSILLACFGKGELRAENAVDMQRVVDVLAELAPRAEKAGVILGLESYLSAETNLKIIDQVKSKAIQVYYDVFNLGVTRKYDVVKELKLLGRDRICEIHFKERTPLLGASKAVDWPVVAATIQEIRFPGWIVLEMPHSDNFAADTKANIAYVRKLFSSKP